MMKNYAVYPYVPCGKDFAFLALELGPCIEI
jgi:hypothetical protein